MQTIRKRLSILLVLCSITAILLITLFVNITVNNKFNSYMIDIQKKRYDRIVDYFQEVYKSDEKWSDNSGIEIMHEAYMSNYYLTLLDNSRDIIWGMNPSDVKDDIKLSEMPSKDKGVYNSKRFPIKYNDHVVGYIDIGQYSSVLLSEEDINFKTSINKSIIASSILTLAIIVLISLYFSKQLSIPIKEIAKMSMRLSTGNFKIKSNIKSNIEELENLRISINILSDTLNYQDTLRKRLISDISHEIRTPLNVLQNTLEAMIDGVFPVTTNRLNYLNEEVIRFGKLLNNLNTLKEFESESMQLNFEIIDLDELIIDIYKDFYMNFKSRYIKLNYKFQPNQDYYIKGDRDKLKQVFINVLSNTLKFVEENGEVTISLSISNKNIIVKIHDNGIGINEEDLPFIFERLYRGDKSRHQVEGSGIGLTVVKNILDLHFATIEVKSILGEYTIFTITFNKIKT